MALAASITPDRFRFDSYGSPVITFSGVTNIPVLMRSDWDYFYNPTSPFDLPPRNRTKFDCPLMLRNVFFPATWVLGTDISQDTPTQAFTNIGVDALDGAVYGTVLSAVHSAITARSLTAHDVVGISLQDSSGTIHHDYSMSTVAHAIVLGMNGLGSIYELGSKLKTVDFPYEAGDSAMIELQGSLIRYFLIKVDGTLVKLRATRSKLTTTPKAEVQIFTAGASADQVHIFNNEEYDFTYDSIGVLENFQDWVNDFSHVSTADPIQMADNIPEYTFPNSKRILRSLSPNLNMRVKADRDDFLDFFEYHNYDKDFLFIDNAHLDRDGNSTEFWANFTSPFGDKVRNNCLAQLGTQILESYRKDFILKILPPTSGLMVDGSGFAIVDGSGLGIEVFV
jgi:hypothetical protein